MPDDMSSFEKRGRLAVKIMAVKMALFVLLIIAIICIGLALHH